MRRLAPLFIALGTLIAGCSGGAGTAPAPVARAPLGLSVPPRTTQAVPAARNLAVPAAPAGLAGLRPPVANAARDAFFSGEIPLGNDPQGDAVYYLSLGSTNFGYYSYLSDSHYVYHFDMGFGYYFDSTDPQTQYLYDFGSKHFWYTNVNLFPFIYDFTFKSFIYYFPDANDSTHYTTAPRYFYVYSTSQYITM